MTATVATSNAGDLHGFTSDKKQDLYGYYMPAGTVRFGKFVFNNIYLGEPSDFTAYEAGSRAPRPYAPVMFNFDDTTSQKKTGELGEYYVNAPRVLPAAYRIAGNSITFVGHDKQLGVVSFAGTLDLKAVKAVQDGGIDRTVLKGDLTVGAKTIKNITFTWFAGD